MAAPIGKDGSVFVLVSEVRGLHSDRHYFAKVYLDKEKVFKTQTLVKTNEPKFEEHARNIPLSPSKPAEKLRFALFSHSLWDTCLAEAEVPLEELYDGVPRDVWYPLKKSAKSDKVKGEMHAQILYLEPGDSMSATFDEFPFPLQTLMKKKKLDQFKRAVGNSKYIEVPDRDGNRPLHSACQLDLPDCVQVLLEKGADIKGTDTNEDALPIHKAAGFCARAIKVLIDKGADVNASDKSGKKPIHYAAINNNAKSIAILLENNAQLDAQDNDGQTALHRALQEKEAADAIRILVEKGADVNKEDKKNVSPANLCITPAVNEKMRKAFLRACSVVDEREFPLRKVFPKKKYLEGRNLSIDWKDNPQFAVVTQPGTSKIRILMHYDYEDKTVLPMEKIRFMVSQTTQGIHKEPSYQQGHLGYGTNDPFEINIPEDKVGQQNFYVLMPSSKTPDVTGYFDMIVYADGDFEANELQPWKHSSKIDGEWTADQSAGSKENSNWLSNPQFLLKAPAGQEKLPVCVHLAQAKAALDLIPFQVTPYQFWIGFYVIDKERTGILHSTKQFLNSQDVYLHFDLDTTKATEFIVVVATHKPNQLTTFTLTALSDEEVTVGPKLPFDGK
eukprot:TRINITY_DN3581_c0_g1_i1.p1 TRINITY_DN3581_c0_g1~~TRINITY_DN3581_c0_g1_i1.p1  ORF type:complete len:616 (-),score=199.53 TRINITY_DN3581_c0_g1_i1:140-1987(-)